MILMGEMVGWQYYFDKPNTRKAVKKLIYYKTAHRMRMKFIFTCNIL